MEDNSTISLITPPHSRFSYTISVDGSTQMLTIREATAYLELKYAWDIEEHNSVLDTFDAISQQFHTRKPLNRRETKRHTGQNIPYEVLLTRNIDDRIKYGYGDPSVIKVPEGDGHQYYSLVTSNDAPESFPILKSPNLHDWQLSGFVFPRGSKPAWAANGPLASDYWAAEMHYVANEYRVYYVAREQRTRELCIGMARGMHPEGPFTSSEVPILKGNVIDPHIYVDEAGTSFLFWKEDNNDVWPSKLVQLLYTQPGLIDQLFSSEADQRTACLVIALWPWIQLLDPMKKFMMLQVFIEAVIENFHSFNKCMEKIKERYEAETEITDVLAYMRTPVYAQQLSADGTKLVGERKFIIENDQPWEGHLVEGIWLHKHKELFFLFYAGNDFSTDQYGIGVATSSSPFGPYRKNPAPLLQSTEQWWAPGHPSVVTTENGKTIMLLHAYPPGKAGYKEFRALLSVELKFEQSNVILKQPD